MQEYELPIVVTNQGPAAPALLKVIRLPTSWYAAIWESAERYAKDDPKFGPLYAEHKAAYEESLMLEAKTLGMVGSNVDLLEQLIRDVHTEGGATSRRH